jgi:DNA modification methylase
MTSQINLEEIKPNNIYLGDCLKLTKKIKNNSIDLILTDLPYNTKISDKVASKHSKFKKEDNKGNRLNGFFNDSYSDKEYKNLIKNIFSECYKKLKEDKPLYVFIDFIKIEFILFIFIKT